MPSFHLPQQSPPSSTATTTSVLNLSYPRCDQIGRQPNPDGSCSSTDITVSTISPSASRPLRLCTPDGNPVQGSTEVSLVRRNSNMVPPLRISKSRYASIRSLSTHRAHLSIDWTNHRLGQKSCPSLCTDHLLAGTSQAVDLACPHHQPLSERPSTPLSPVVRCFKRPSGHLAQIRPQRAATTARDPETKL